MKKITFFLTLALLFCANVAQAGYTIGEMVQTISDGNLVFVGSSFNRDGDRELSNYRWVSNRKNSATYTEGENPTTSDVFQVVANTEMGMGYFSLKNIRNGKYIAYGEKWDEDDEEGNLANEMKFSTELSEAWAFQVYEAEIGAQLLGYDGDRAVPTDGSVVLLSNSPEGRLVALNQAYYVPTLATYNDWATWWQIYTAEPTDDPVEDLTNIVLEALDAAYLDKSAYKYPVYVGGTNPGAYDQATVDAFYAAFAEALEFVESGQAEQNPDQCPAMQEKLTKAYDALLEAKPVEMREGLFRFISGNYLFAQKQNDIEKAMYAEPGKAMWKTLDAEDLTQVWKITKQDSASWKVMNMSTNQYFLSGSQSSQVTMADESTNYITFTQFDYTSLFRIRMLDPEMDLHTNGHSAGAGVSSNIVLWNGNPGDASSWFIREVTAEELKTLEAIDAQKKLNAKFAELLATAQTKYSIAEQYIPNMEDSLLFEAAQISSNADHNSLNSSPDGGGIEALVDNAAGTFFHSCWASGPAEDHYLQFELKKEVSTLAFALTRRTSQALQNNNFPKNVTLYGAAADADITDAASWKRLTQVTDMAPESAEAIPSYTFNGADLDGSYKYIRFEVNLTGPNSGQHNGHCFFTLDDIQLYTATLDPNSQIGSMGQIGVDMKNAIKTASAIENATEEDYEALKAAYDAFMAAFPDPTELNNKIAEANTLVNGVAFGSNPGNFPEATPEEEALAIALETAEAIIADGAYTKEVLAENVVALTEALEAFKALEIGIDTEMWYTINVPSIYFEKTGKNLKTSSGKAMTVKGGSSDEGLRDSSITAQVFADLAEPEMAQFRFIALGDTAYIIQHRATGDFLSYGGGHRKLSAMPSMFKVKSLGYSGFLIEGYRYDNVAQYPIHLQDAGEVLVGWPAYDLGSNSMFEIQAVEEITDEPENPTFTWDLVNGYPYFLCYPNDLEFVSDAAVYVLEGVNEEGFSFYDICNVDADSYLVPGGTPFVLMSGSIDDYKIAKERNGSDTTTVEVISGINISNAPIQANYMVGNYYGATAPVGAFIAKESKDGYIEMVALESKASMGSNTAYINLLDTQLGYDEENAYGDLFIPSKEDYATGINKVVAKIGKENVNVYTATGILVRKNVKAGAATTGLAKGLYIVGNNKVLVK